MAGLAVCVLAGCGSGAAGPLGRGTNTPGAGAATVLATPAVSAPRHAVIPGFRTGPRRERARYRDGLVLVGFRAGTPAARQLRIARVIGLHALRRLGGSGATRLNFIGRVRRGEVSATVSRLRAMHDLVRFAEPDYVLHASGTTVPNDPSFALQWGSLNTGQLVNGVLGTAGADDAATRAWSLSTGSHSIVVGVVDTGLEYTHPDLAANVWSNPGGVGGCAAGTHGYNVVASSCDPMDNDTSYGGHGTHVAGIIGAHANNGVGVAGLDWNATLLPVKWLDSNGSGSTDQLISALNWLVAAKQAGVNIRVVNDSATFVGTAYSQALSDEIDTLGANGILFVTAAGNTGDNNDNLSVRRYPCGYDRPTEICATASNSQDRLPSWANYGATTVDLAAPGDTILSTLRGGSYGYISGGSMAAAQVSGAAALILSVSDMSPGALKSDILTNVDPLPALSGLVRTGGRLDVCRAMPGCSTAAPPPAVPVVSGLPVVSGSVQVGSVLSASTGSWSGSPTGYAYAWQQCDSSGGGCVPISGAATSSYTVQSADVGHTLRVAVTASNAGGASAPAVSAATVVVPAPQTPSGTPVSFGNSVVGTGFDSFTANRKRVNAYAVSSTVAVSKLSIYLESSWGAGKALLEGVIYSDAGGSPGNLLGVSGELAFANTQSTGWYDLKFASPVTLSPGTYWIGVITGGTSYAAGFAFTAVGGSRVFNANTYTAGPTAVFGAASTDYERMSLYATGTGG